MRTRDIRALVCLVLAALVVAVSLAAALSQKAERRSGTNGVWPVLEVATVYAGSGGCQSGELLPAGTSVVRLLAEAIGSPASTLHVTLRRHGRVLARGTATPRPGNYLAADASIPRTTRDYDDVEVCFKVGRGGGVLLVGGPTPPDVGRLESDAVTNGGSITITYARAGEESWWSFASTMIRRIGLGRGSWGGTWIVWLALALVLTSIALATWTLVATVLTDRGRLRTTVRAIAVVAVLNAAAWSLLTPMFQVPDEETHVAYAQQIAEAGRPPIKRAVAEFPEELTTIMGDVRFGANGRHTYATAVWSPLQQRRLDRHLHAGLSRRGNDDAGATDFEPPLYYALEAVPYRLAVGATLLDRIALMRLLSALMAGITALFVFLFVRECLPGRPWAWTVGGLGVAFMPLFGFVSGGVNPDALLFAVSAALFYCVARAFRRGLDTQLAIWTGVVMAIGLITKINFYGLLPGALVGLALAARACERVWDRDVARRLGIMVGIAVAPYALMTLLDAFVWERAFILARTPASAPRDAGGLGAQFSYLWQVYFPRLPGQMNNFPEAYPGYELWFKGLIGRFGWVVVTFSLWVYRMAAIIVVALVALALRTAYAEREELRSRRAELFAYVLTAVVLVLVIGLVALRGWAPGIAGAVQGRYVLPLLPLFGAALALAARGGGERWGRALGVVIVMTAVAWSVFSQLVTIAFFYG